MKIRLNENEVYEIKLPEEIGVNELYMIAARFNSLLKNFSRINLVGCEPQGIVLGEKPTRTYKKQNREQWDLLRENRNIFLELLKTYYNKSPEEFEDFKAKHNLTMDRSLMASIQTIRLKELHNIKPNELGLIKFPNKYEQIQNLRIK
jgi:hypothetical protein